MGLKSFHDLDGADARGNMFLHETNTSDKSKYLSIELINTEINLSMTLILPNVSGTDTEIEIHGHRHKKCS